VHGHGIAGALWSAGRRLALVPDIRIIAIGFLAAVFFEAAILKAKAVECDLMGSNFTSISVVYSPADRVPGSIVLPAPLAPPGESQRSYDVGQARISRLKP
jgi:hypothetical protein